MDLRRCTEMDLVCFYLIVKRENSLYASPMLWQREASMTAARMGDEFVPTSRVAIQLDLEEQARLPSYCS